MRNSVVFAGLAMALAMPLSAPAVAGGAPEATDKDKLVCKYRQKTGTRFKTKTCKTAGQWEALSQEHQRTAKELVDRPQIKVCGPNGCD